MAVTWETVRKVAQSLEKIEETTSYGTAAFKTSGKLFVRQHQDGKSLVVATTFEERDELMQEDAETFYITDHYTNYPWVLVSMARISEAGLRDLLRGAARHAIANGKESKPKVRR